MLFTEGVEKYGGANSNATAVAALVTANEWTSTSGGISIVSQIGFPGVAIQLSGLGTLTKTLGSNEVRLTGGLRFSSLLGTTLMQFQDLGTIQSYITVQPTGIITYYDSTAAVINSGAVISANSVHYLEFDITFGAAAAYEVWLDGASLFSGTADTATGTANDYANQIVVSSGFSVLTFRDLYLDTSLVANTNPKITTNKPTGDDAVDFAFGAAVLGQAYSASASVNAPGANTLFLRKFTPVANCTLNSVTCLPQTSTVGKIRAVAYSDSAGIAGTLLSSGTEVIGTTAGTYLSGNLVTPQSLTAATPYWVGFMCDTAVNLALADGTVTGVKAAATYTSGAPGSAPAMTVAQSSWLIFGNVTGIATRWPEVANAPPVGDYSYVQSSTVNDEDLYTFPSIGTPDFVYCVAVKGNMRKSDTGVRTVDLQLKSGGTTDSGSNSGQSPATTYGWLSSYYDQDPDTSMDWDAAGVDASTAGQKIAT